jgi:hypothetical protein
MHRWGVAASGCKLVVKELPLKGTGEARCSAAKTPGLMKKEQGKFKRSGF